MTHTFYGRRTGAFEVLEEGLVVVEYHADAESGTVRKLGNSEDVETRGGQLVDPVKIKSARD